jgi:aminoglycoside phosphotransferase family enzyme
MNQQTDNALINSLLTALPHTNETIKLVETHISWVLLTGDYVYKIKKPVDFGFLNFTSLEKRKFFCGEELRLNSRLAPDLYLAVLPITGTIEQPTIDGSGETLDYTVKMKQFSEEGLMDRLAASGQISAEMIDQLADTIADFHAEIAVAQEDSPLGTAEAVQAPVTQNFEQILPLLSSDKERSELKVIEAWSNQQFQSLKTTLDARHLNGFIRECHGDLHLGNIVVIDDQPVLFDCIEFNDEFRWTDVINEIAFIVMDLMMRNLKGFAFRLLNRYLEKTGDYEGIALLNYYITYRAMVRAKIARFTMGHMSEGSPEQQQQIEQYQSYINLALQISNNKKPLLMITHGLSGSGKSFVSSMVLEEVGAIRVRSDIERKRLTGFEALSKTKSDLDDGIYGPETGQKTYKRLLELAEIVVQSGYPVIIDATFLKQTDRATQQQLAEKLDANFIILNTEAPVEKLEQFIAQRAKVNKDPSEADLAVLAKQLEKQELLTEAEKQATLTLDSSGLPETGKEVLLLVKSHIKSVT